jgi:hypothetical protein
MAKHVGAGLPCEVSISHRARSREEGKKLTRRDGVAGGNTALRFGLSRRAMSRRAS